MSEIIQKLFLQRLHPYYTNRILNSKYFNEIEANNYKRFQNDIFGPIINIEPFAQLVKQGVYFKSKRKSTPLERTASSAKETKGDKYIIIGGKSMEMKKSFEVGPTLQYVAPGEHLLLEAKSGKTIKKTGPPEYQPIGGTHLITCVTKGWLAIAGRNGCIVLGSNSSAIIAEPILIVSNDGKCKIKQFDAINHQTLRLGGSGHLALKAHGVILIYLGSAGLVDTSTPLVPFKSKVIFICKNDRQTGFKVLVIQIGSSLKVLDETEEEIGCMGTFNILNSIALPEILNQIKKPIKEQKFNSSQIRYYFDNHVYIGETVCDHKREGLRVWKEGRIFESQREDLPKVNEEVVEPIVFLSNASTLVLIGKLHGSDKIEIIQNKSKFAIFHGNLFIVKNDGRNTMIDKITVGTQITLGSGFHLALCGDDVHIIFTSIGKYVGKV